MSISDKIKRRPWLVYVLAILLPLAVGGLSAILSMGGMRAYAQLVQPPLSPPGWLFPVVWTILYVLMGLSSACVYLSDNPAKQDALKLYALQLFLNFGWSILFFGFSLFLAAFVWIVILEAVILVMIASFYAVCPKAAYLQIPYALWVAFAAYLNLAVFLLNRAVV